jgi:hypothetical protein
MSDADAGPDLSPSNLSPKEIADVFIAIGQDYTKRYAARIDYQWKINLGLWAGLIAALVGDIRHKTHLGGWLVILSLAIFFVVFIRWTYFVQHAHRRNNQEAERLFDMAESLVARGLPYGQCVAEDGEHKDGELSANGVRYYPPGSVRRRIHGRSIIFTSWSPVFECLVTGGLVVLNVLNWLY